MQCGEVQILNRAGDLPKKWTSAKSWLSSSIKKEVVLYSVLFDDMTLT
jgi:hypothetical protein